MKKFISVAVVIMLLLSLTACGKDNSGQAYSYTPSTTDSEIILEHAKNGKVPEIICHSLTDETETLVSVSLGMKRSDLVEIFGEDNLTTTKDSKYKKVATDAAHFYFDVNDTAEAKGIIAIVVWDPIYGFGVTSTADDVEARLGKPVKRYNTEEGELFFFPYSKGVTAECVTYNQGKNTLSFYFVSGSMSATVLSVTAEW